MGLYLGHFDFEKPLIWTVQGLLTESECKAILACVMDGEWLAATVNRSEGRAVDTRLRDNSVAIVRDERLADDLFERVRPHVPPTMSTEIGDVGRVKVELAGIFLPLRVYRYEPGQQFGLHQDQSYLRSDGARSLLTFLVYLNDNFEGGTTDFPEQNKVIAPTTGSALLFQHMVLHAGTKVERGTKYVLRSDILYRRAA
ncbi:MAG: 2OG-Fe(II) oxygenase [Polyangiaceae bacterium]